MSRKSIITGYSSNNLPFARIGTGPEILVAFEGLNFNHTPPKGMSLKMNAKMFMGLPDSYTVYLAGRKPDLPINSTMEDIAEDYAVMIREDIGEPVCVAGMSTGGPPAMCLAAEHPELVRKLVLISTGYCLSDFGKKAQLRMLEAARTGSKRKTAAATSDLLFHGFTGTVMKALFWLTGPLMYPPGNSLSDGIAELTAEDRFNFADRLKDIKVPTLLIGGEDDPLYPIRETAEGIPGADLILYPNSGHAASLKKEFKLDLLKFLQS